jgi:hypothetical protein
LATPQGAPGPEQRVAALKQSIQESQGRLRKYEWIQTTIVSLKGEEKNRKQERCYYGADGTVQKVLLDGQSAAPPQGGRLRQRIFANKKEDMKEYMDYAAQTTLTAPAKHITVVVQNSGHRPVER